MRWPAVLIAIPYTVWVYLVVVVATGVCAIGYLLTSFVSRKLADPWGHVWGVVVMRSITSIDVEGRDHLPDDAGAILANHSSFLDILALQSLPLTLRFVAKRLFFRIPFLGWVLQRRGDVLMDKTSGGAKQNTRAMVRAIESRCGAETLATWPGDGQRRVLVVFPEGTRSRDGVLKLFRTRNLARHITTAGLPVTPVAIDGTHRLWPPGAWLLRPARVRVIATPPILTDDPQALLETAHAQVARALGVADA